MSQIFLPSFLFQWIRTTMLRPNGSFSGDLQLFSSTQGHCSSNYSTLSLNQLFFPLLSSIASISIETGCGIFHLKQKQNSNNNLPLSSLHHSLVSTVLLSSLKTTQNNSFLHSSPSLSLKSNLISLSLPFHQMCSCESHWWLHTVKSNGYFAVPTFQDFIRNTWQSLIHSQ